MGVKVFAYGVSGGAASELTESEMLDAPNSPPATFDSSSLLNHDQNMERSSHLGSEGGLRLSAGGSEGGPILSKYWDNDADEVTGIAVTEEEVAANEARRREQREVQRKWEEAAAEKIRVEEILDKMRLKNSAHFHDSFRESETNNADCVIS